MDDPRRGHTSASSAQADLLCPGRHLAQKGLPEVEHDGAASGRKIHAALKNSSDTATLNALNSRERDIFDSCREIEKKVVISVFGNEHPPMRVFREERKRVTFGFGGKMYEHSGESDAFYIAGAKGLVVDYKSLMGEVASIDENAQIRDNIVLIRGDLMRQGQILVECFGVIIQPLVTRDPKVVRYDEPSMDRAAREMMERVVRSNDPRSPRVPGELQCRYCRATGVCREYQVWASATLPTFRDITKFPVEQWTPEQRTIFMDRYAIAEQWLKDTKNAMEAGVRADPNFVPGYAMQDGVVKYPITDLSELIRRITLLHGGTPEDLLIKAGKISKEDLEIYFKSLIKKTVKGSIEQNKAYEALLKGITTPKPNKPTLKKI